MSIAEELKKEGKKEIVRAMLKKDIQIEEVVEISGFSKEEIKELQKGMKH
ncbi:MAG: hypothetical protein ACQEP9_07255 [Bacillota bacterium]